jgi:hypothetical protein
VKQPDSAGRPCSEGEVHDPEQDSDEEGKPHTRIGNCRHELGAEPSNPVQRRLPDVSAADGDPQLDYPLRRRSGTGAYASYRRWPTVDHEVTRSEVPMEKMNREQRRREKYGHAGGATKEPWPQSEANPVFGQGGDSVDNDVKARGDAATDAGVPELGAAPKTKPGSSAKAKGPRKAVDLKVGKTGNTAKG